MSNGYLKENQIFQKFQRGPTFSRGGGGGGGGPNASFYRNCLSPIEDLDQTASLRVLYIKARVQSLFKVKTKTDQTLGCADGFEYLLCAHDNLYPAHSYTYYGLLC